MASELRVNKLTNRSGLGTVTYSDTGAIFTGIITATSFSGPTGHVSIADKIIHTGDTDTALRFPAADTFTVETAGSERIRVDGSGRLLIGTTTEGYVSADNLTVADAANAGITIRSGTGNLGTLAFSDGTTGAAEYDGYIQYSQADQYMDFGGAGGNIRLRIASDGDIHVGGTARPTPTVSGFTIENNGKDVRWSQGGGTSGTDMAGLAIFGGGSSTNVMATASWGGNISLHNTNNTDGNSSCLSFCASTQLATSFVVGETTSHSSRNGELVFATSSGAAPTERLRITSAGRVGINANSPNTELEIQAATDPKIRLQSQESGSKRLDLWVDGGTAISYIAADQSASQLAFRTAGSERLRITSTGNVGINQSSPDSNAMLDVMSDKTGTTANSNRVALFRTNGGGRDAHITLSNSSNTPVHIGQLSSNLYFTTNNAERMRIDSGGRIGIGTNVPDTNANLHIEAASVNELRVETVDSSSYGILRFAESDHDGSKDKYIISYGDSHSAQADQLSIKNQIGAITFMAGGVATSDEKMRIKSGGGVEIQQGNNNYPTDFIGGASNGRNYVRVKAGNTTSGHSSGVKLNHSDGNGVISMFINHDDDHGHIMNEHQGGDILFYTNESGSSLEKMRINSKGIVTRPKHSAFKAHGGAAWINFANGWNSIGGSSSGTVNPQWSTSSYNGFDNQNEFDETNGRFVATVSGDYYFWYMMYIKKNVNTQSNYIHINPYVNGQNKNAYTIYGREQAITNGTHVDGATGGWSGALAAGDYFQWWVYCDGANNFQFYGGHCLMGGWLIG